MFPLQLFSSSSYITSLLYRLLTAYLTVRVCKSLFLLLKIVYIWCIRPKLDLTPYKDLWTVVTGGTDGIGKAYVTELARRGLRKFFLIGRNPNKLQDVAEMLQKNFKCEVETAVFDFAFDDLKTLPPQLTKYEIGILVNCVGKASDHVASLTEQLLNEASTIFQINTMSAIKMMELIVPGMVERDLGIVVNVSSILGWRPWPYLSSYPASKAALSFFTAGLVEEYKNTNLFFQCLMPCLVATNLSKYGKEEADGWVVVSADTFAKDAVDCIGYPMATGCKKHDLQIALGEVCSFWIFQKCIAPFLLNDHKKRLEKILATKNEN